MLDRAHAPTLLVEERIRENAPDRQLGVLFDRIVLEVFVAAVSVDEVSPTGVALPDPTAEGEPHRGGFDVERLVVFHDANGVEWVELFRVRFDRFEKEAEAQAFEEEPSLPQVFSAADREGEGLQTRRAHAEGAQDVLRDEKDRPAVHAAGKADPDRLGRRDRPQPLGDFFRQGADVASPDLVQVGREDVAGRREKTRVRRFRVGAADEPEFDDVMSRDHPRVARLKLFLQTVGEEAGVDGVDPVRDDEHRPVGPLGQEVAQRPVERPSHPDREPVARHERKGSVDPADVLDRAPAHALSRLLECHAVETVSRGVGQIQDALDGPILHDSA